MPKRKPRNQSLKQRVKALEMRLGGGKAIGESTATIKSNSGLWAMTTNGLLVVDKAFVKAAALIEPFGETRKSLSQGASGAVAQGSFC